MLNNSLPQKLEVILWINNALKIRVNKSLNKNDYSRYCTLSLSNRLTLNTNHQKILNFENPYLWENLLLPSTISINTMIINYFKQCWKWAT
ncbi:unnamed protein product [Paramecium octaurelia]|uniref:Uncharacterized protein n=1 Tax=Paramecium octaurelia TaxID=43137 RepID=A0A8S1YJI5_PAROT|nr:unnamed protein product [Paramecium octaurelia]